MHATTTGIPMLLYILSKTLANSINIWVLSTKIGWRAVIPIAVTASYSISSHWITAKTNEFNKQNKIKRQPRFYTNFGTMAANMRTIKFYGWERAFYNVRADDYNGNIAVPTALRLLGFTIGLIGGSISQVAAALTVISYLQSSNTLSYPDILLVISSTAALSELVLSVAGTPEVLQRMRKNEEDIARLIVEPVQTFLDHGPLSATKAIEMSNCEFQWGEGKFSLKPITLNIAAGELIVIMGSVGSGKSSLVSALCGSMQLTGGDGCIYGRIGYVGQKPWIMNATFRENVVFGREYDEAFYQEVLVACALIEDVKGFPAGDMSEIGHKGINLSGGQKTRLALARAIYSRADVYIMDDILAAVDAYVERHIVDNVLTGHGIISSKTRILVTHSEHIAPLASKFITMTDGCVEVASQVPITVSASSPQSPIQPNGGSSNNSSEGGQGMFTANPEENMQAFEWPYIWRYLAMSGYSGVGISLLIQVLSTYAIFYVENLRMDLLSDKNHDTMMRSLQQYLVADALVDVFLRRLCTAARDNLWKMLKSSTRYNPYGLTAEVCIGSDMMRLNGVLEPYLNRCTSLFVDGWLLDIKWRLPDTFEAVVRDLSIAGMNSVVLLFNIWRRLDPNSTLTPGEVEMMMRLSEQFLHRLRQMLGIATNLDNHLPSLARYYTYQELPREELGRSTGASLPEIWPSEGTIEFQDYSMRYRKDLDLVLNQVTFAVRRQEKIGIVGRTGAGKSSLTHALMRMVTPASGSVYIDGVDISSINLSALRSSISIIPQDPALFNGTIRENMDPLHETIVNTPTELYRTDDQNSGPWVEGTGLDKWVEDGGKNFSIGQRQLVSLCRALLWKRKILVLDEATANRVIREEFRDCTILTIAHRLRTVMDSDRILVMDQGRVAEFDTPASLLARDSLFKSLVESMELNEKR
ncbi:P-loop containing nucleoside triphosphate hydrolase protein [Linderina pennispora]|uniref:p-loop containing nucleoside triphosphate hydrolase protein n=1 Tax=Linderina pennispora TaxID=61395 RepID=A0A1Y1VZM0_9FUNG|nr:P-loop containing nucleoside triphosphate hydrolase protein [Linderina pennispora]ORX66711.1 P-loop containing nucleoside triphosphate hydrolase protein [Linderina pennispora]